LTELHNNAAMLKDDKTNHRWHCTLIDIMVMCSTKAKMTAFVTDAIFEGFRIQPHLSACLSISTVTHEICRKGISWTQEKLIKF